MVEPPWKNTTQMGGHLSNKDKSARSQVNKDHMIQPDENGMPLQSMYACPWPSIVSS